MSQYGQGFGRQTVSAIDRNAWEKPAAADDIVDPIDIGPGGTAPEAGLDPYAVAGTPSDRERTDDEAEDVPLDVQFTDALSMLAEGGHSYSSTPLAADAPLDTSELDPEPADAEWVDESSKDA